MRDAVDQLEAELGDAFDQHQLAPILRSVPGLAPFWRRGCWLRSAMTQPGSPAPSGCERSPELRP